MSFRILGEPDLLEAREQDRVMLRDVADGRVNPAQVVSLLDLDRRELVRLADKMTKEWGRWLWFCGALLGLLVGFGAGVGLMVWVRW